MSWERKTRGTRLETLLLADQSTYTTAKTLRTSLTSPSSALHSDWVVLFSFSVIILEKQTLLVDVMQTLFNWCSVLPNMIDRTVPVSLVDSSHIVRCVTVRCVMAQFLFYLLLKYCTLLYCFVYSLLRKSRCFLLVVFCVECLILNGYTIAVFLRY